MPSNDPEAVLKSAAFDAMDRWPKGDPNVVGFDPAILITLITSIIAALVQRCPQSTATDLRGQALDAQGFWGFWTRATVKTYASRTIRAKLGTKHQLGAAEFAASRDALADLVLREAVERPMPRVEQVVAAARSVQP